MANQKMILVKIWLKKNLSAYEYVNNKSTQGYTTEPCDLERLLTEGWEIQSVTALEPANKLDDPNSCFALMILRRKI